MAVPLSPPRMGMAERAIGNGGAVQRAPQARRRPRATLARRRLNPGIRRDSLIEASDDGDDVAHGGALFIAIAAAAAVASVVPPRDRCAGRSAGRKRSQTVSSTANVLAASGPRTACADRRAGHSPAGPAIRSELPTCQQARFRPVALVVVVVVAGQHGDHAHHRRAEVAVRILNAAIGPRRHRLVVRIEMGVEAAVVDEGAGMVEA
jgi:hypothetical protein